MDKIAIISDIHGNLESLTTVLNDIHDRGINKIYCLGDILAKGAHQQECADLIRKHCEVIIKGNCDEIISMNFGESNLRAITETDYNWNRSQINDETADFFRNLPYCHEFYLSGRLIRLLHAHPESVEKVVASIDKLENFYSLFLPSSYTSTDKKADILIYGHLHTPFSQKIYNRFILNPGSVGNAMDVIRNDEKDGDVRNTTVANYLILSGKLDSKDFNNPISFEFVNIPYNIDKELSANSDNFALDLYSDELRNGKYREMDRISKNFASRGIDVDNI